MVIIKTVKELRQYRLRFAKKSMGFVPTMGNLHKGHSALIERSVQENVLTIVSIFVNPLQFTKKEDYLHYPNTIEVDKSLCASLSVDALFIPPVSELYAEKERYIIQETGEMHCLEGQYRPGHFAGVLTVILKLLQLVQPRCIYLGEKDYQQYRLIVGLVQAFFLETEVVLCSTIRNAYGVAYSSRNSRLNAKQLAILPDFFHALHTEKTCNEVRLFLEKKGFVVEYIEQKWGRRFGAVFLGEVRLIDNIPIPHDIM